MISIRRILFMFGCLLLPTFACGQGWQRERREIYESFPEEPLYRAYLPPAADLSLRFPKPGDQGGQGSCTAWAVGYAVRTYYEGLVRGWDLEAKSHIVSPASIFNKLTHDRACRDGAAISDALKLLRRDGADDLASVPYTPAACADPGEPNRYEPRDRWRIADWRRVDMARLDNIKGEIARGNPVMFGLDYSQSLLELRGAAIYDDIASARAGGHAMVVVGYDDARQAFKVMNSWGAQWGDRGFGWISYRAMQALSDRGFVMSVAGKPAPPPPGPIVPPLPRPKLQIAALLPLAVEPPQPAPIVTSALQPPALVIDAPPVAAIPPPVESLPPNPILVGTLQSHPPSLTLTVLPLPPAPESVVPKPVAEDPRLKLARVLADLQCAKVDIARRHGRITGATGFVAIPEDRQRLAEALGGDHLAAGVHIVPWPHCEALLTFATALAKDDGLRVQIADGRPAFTDGESLIVEVTTPDFPSYLYVTYLQTSGAAVHLAQPLGLAPMRYPPRSKVSLGGGGAQPTYRIGPPFGREMIVVIASASPLFAGARPPVEMERDYLTAFRMAFLAKPEPQMPDRIVAAAVTTLATGSRDVP